MLVSSTFIADTMPADSQAIKMTSPYAYAEKSTLLSERGMAPGTHRRLEASIVAVRAKYRALEVLWKRARAEHEALFASGRASRDQSQPQANTSLRKSSQIVE
jgi:hypothetical protein